MGVFIFVCSLICLVIAVDKYYSAIATATVAASELAKEIPGFELESVGIPNVTLACGTVGVMLLVASVILIFNSFRQIESDS